MKWSCDRCPAFARTPQGARALRLRTCRVAEAAALWGLEGSASPETSSPPGLGSLASGPPGEPLEAAEGPPDGPVGDDVPPSSATEGLERLLAFKRVRFAGVEEQWDSTLADTCRLAKAARVQGSDEPRPSSPSPSRARSSGAGRGDGSEAASGGPRPKAPRLRGPSSALPPEGRPAPELARPDGPPPPKRARASGGLREGPSWTAREAVPSASPLPAQGPVGPASARGHHIYLVGGTLAFCRRCGARAQPSAARSRLWGSCQGHASSKDSTYLKALELGKEPLSGEWRGEPRPLLVSDDACFWLRLR